jgi:hypothetical protein
MLQFRNDEVLNPNRCGRVPSIVVAIGFVFALVLAAAPSGLRAQQEAGNSPAQKEPASQAQAIQTPEETHHFFDRTNVMLFAGVAAVRTLDYTSTRHFRSQGNNEVMLTNSIVDNKPLFTGIEVAGTALSIGVAYWLHRTGHHKLERWVSIVHIGAGAVGDIHNYTLGAPPTTP